VLCIWKLCDEKSRIKSIVFGVSQTPINIK
jgi:hypothetical protein